jgi:hypothetical protein
MKWLTIIDAHGRRRLEDPDDFVRVEIEAALTRKVRVIPILVDGAKMPHADKLPPSLAKLVRRQALELGPTRFEYDTSRLLAKTAIQLIAFPGRDGQLAAGDVLLEVDGHLQSGKTRHG